MIQKGIRWVPSIAALAVIVLTCSLGNWQTRRAAEKLEMQAARDRAAALPLLALDPRSLAEPGRLIGQRVSAEGRFLELHSVFVDNRTYRGQAGFHVLTPFQVEGLAPVLVLRGWVPQDPAARTRLPVLTEPAGAVRIEATVQHDLDQVLELGRAVPPRPDERLWQNASVAKVATWSGLGLAPILLRQTAEEPLGRHAGTAAPSSAVTLVRDWPSPGAGVEKHRAYAFQWYSMAVLVTALWMYFLWRSRRLQP